MVLLYFHRAVHKKGMPAHFTSMTRFTINKIIIENSIMWECDSRSDVNEIVNGARRGNGTVFCLSLSLDSLAMYIYREWFPGIWCTFRAENPAVVNFTMHKLISHNGLARMMMFWLPRRCRLLPASLDLTSRITHIYTYTTTGITF